MTPSPDSINLESPSGSAFDLEFPDSSGLERRPQQISLSEAVRKCRELRSWFPNSIPTREARWADKREVEFRL